MKDGKLVNLQYLRDAMDNDADLIHEILDIFLHDTHEEIKKMEIAVAEKRWSDVAKIAHRMKSSMLNLGLEEISEELYRIEVQINQDNNSENAEEYVLRVFQICEDVFTDIQYILET